MEGLGGFTSKAGRPKKIKAPKPNIGQRALGALEWAGDKLARATLYPATSAIMAIQDNESPASAALRGFQGKNKEGWGGVMKRAGANPDSMATKVGSGAANIILDPINTVAPFGLTAKGIKAAKTAAGVGNVAKLTDAINAGKAAVGTDKLGKVGRAAELGERALLTVKLPFVDPVTVIRGGPALKALSKLSTVIKKNPAAQELRSMFSATTGHEGFDAAKAGYNASQRAAEYDAVNKLYKPDKALISEISKATGKTEQEINDWLSSYIEAEQSKDIYGLQPIHEMKRLDELKAAETDLMKKADRETAAARKFSPPSEIQSLFPKVEQESLRIKEADLETLKRGFASRMQKGGKSIGSDKLEQNLATARKILWDNNPINELKGVKVFVEKMDETTASGRMKNAKRAIEVNRLRRLGVNVDFREKKPGERVVSAEDIMQRFKERALGRQYGTDSADNAFDSFDKSEVEDLSDMLSDVGAAGPNGRISKDYFHGHYSPTGTEWWMSGDDAAFVKKAYDEYHSAAGLGDYKIEYAYKRAQLPDETKRLDSIGKREREIVQALKNTNGPEEASALTNELKNIRGEAMRIRRGVTLRASDETRKQILDKVDEIEAEHKQLTEAFNKIQTEATSPEEATYIGNKLVALKVRMATIGWNDDVIAEAKAIRKIEKEIDDLKKTILEKRGKHTEATNAYYKKRAGMTTAGEVSAKYAELNDIRNARKTYQELVQKEMQKGYAGRNGRSDIYIANVRAELQKLADREKRIMATSAGKLASNNLESSNLSLTALKKNDEFMRKTIKRRSALKASAPDPRLIEYAEKIASGNKKWSEYEQAINNRFNPIEGYMSHLMHPDLKAYLNSMPSDRKAKVFSQFDRFSMEREKKGMTIKEANDLAQGGLFPGMEGYKGKVFNDDIAYVNAYHEYRMTKLKNTNDFMGQTGREFGMNSNLFHQAVADGRINPSEYSAVRNKMFESAGGPLENKDGVMYFPREIARELERTFSLMEDAERKNGPVRKLLVDVNRIYKNYTLPVYPSYHVRNMVGNVLNNLLGGVNSPASYREAAEFQAGKNVAIKTPSGIVTRADLERMGHQYGIGDSGFYALESGGLSAIEDIAEKKTLLQKLGGENAAVRVGRKIGTTIEDNARWAHFIHKLKDGYEPAAAAASVKKYLFDYSEIGTFEKDLRLLMPFYTWTRKNVPLQLEHLLTRPGFVTAPERFRQGMQGNAPDERYMSDYMLSNFPMYIKKDPKTGKHLYFLAGGWIPQTDVNRALGQGRNLREILAGTPAQVYQTLSGLVSPFVKEPISQATNNDPFFGEPIQDFPGQTAKFNLPGKQVQIPVRLKHLLSQVRPVNEMNNLFSPDKPASYNATRLMTGIKTNVYDLEKSKARFEREATQKMNKLRSFERYYERVGDRKNLEAVRREMENIRNSR